MNLSRPLQWLLGLTVAASAWVALLDEPAQSTGKLAAQADAPSAHKRSAAGPRQSVVWPVMPDTAADADTPWPDMNDATRSAWQVPPPPPPPQPPPAPKRVAAPPPPPPASEATPQAPAFPYKLIGQFEDQGQRSALLSDDRSTFPAVRDQVIDSRWRVIAVNESGLDVTWLPNGQTLKIGY